MGHPLTYVSSATSSRNRSQTMSTGPLSQSDSTPLELLQNSQTTPADSPIHGNPPSEPDASHTSEDPPEARSQAPSDIDLENGSETSIKKRHWWQRKRAGPRQHSAVTAQAHAKSSFELFKEIMFSSWANLLLVFIPVGIALHFFDVNPTVVFVMNFLAIVPLAGVGSRVPELIGLLSSFWATCAKSDCVAPQFCHRRNCP